jgi:hypothetical protein
MCLLLETKELLIMYLDLSYDPEALFTLHNEEISGSCKTRLTKSSQANIMAIVSQLDC